MQKRLPKYVIGQYFSIITQSDGSGSPIPFQLKKLKYIALPAGTTINIIAKTTAGKTKR
jgi:hypothetical protein